MFPGHAWGYTITSDLGRVHTWRTCAEARMLGHRAKEEEHQLVNIIPSMCLFMYCMPLRP